jgi:hypothetical protein
LLLYLFMACGICCYGQTVKFLERERPLPIDSISYSLNGIGCNDFNYTTCLPNLKDSTLIEFTYRNRLYSGYIESVYEPDNNDIIVELYNTYFDCPKDVVYEPKSEDAFKPFATITCNFCNSLYISYPTKKINK